MGERTRLGLGFLGAALVLGGLGDALLRAAPWGINFLPLVAVLVGMAVLLAKAGRVPLGGRWLAVAALAFAVGVVLRDSPVLVLLDVLAVMLAVSLAVWRGRVGSLRDAGISAYVLGGTYAGVLASAGPVSLSVNDIAWRGAVRGRWKGQALAVSRGLLIDTTLVLVFGGFFVAADAVFERLVLDVFGLDLASIFGHLF